MRLSYRDKSGYKIPENYFENFEGRLFSKLDEESPLDQKITSGFEVPKNYFEKLSVELPEEKESKVLPLFSKKTIRLAVSIAAMLVFMFSVFNEYKNGKISFSTIGYESVESYIENDNIDLQNPDIERIILKEPFSSELKFDKIGEDAIFDYLMNNSSELTFLNR